MSESMITRCPKCSTTFRVTQEVLSMAKGKVRCGQCFHIFTAEPAKSAASAAPKAPLTPAKAPEASRHQATPTKIPEPPHEQTPAAQASVKEAPTPASSDRAPDTVSNDGSVNPDWLNTLFNEEDLAPYTPPKDSNERFVEHMDNEDALNDSSWTPKQPSVDPAKPTSAPPRAATKEDLAPWEMELAELESQLSAQSPASEPVFSETLQPQQSTQPRATVAPNKANLAPEANEPDYMHALHSLAQDVSKHDTLSEAEYSSQESMKQLAAEYSLATLTDNEPPSKTRKRSKYTWLWTLGTLLSIGLLMVQIGIGHFEQGSRSAEFRGFYKVACAYLGCTLPAFEDIDAIDIEHVRIQSHPTLANALQVNAIMTNSSQFAQPMPKLALEFYDLNGRPVAARLFAPKDYLHKDFLDITFMPPNTPIHIVIPIQDPGARAVTHKIKAYSNATQSY